MTIAVSVLTYAILGIGLNVVVGWAGLLDLGYAAFFAIGAYTSSLLEIHLKLNFWQTMPVALVVAGFAGCVIGYPTLRLRSDYLAIVTLGFGEIVRITATNLGVTGGPNGLYGIPPATAFGRQIVTYDQLYYLGLFLLALVVVFTAYLSSSRLGRAWRSLREDETAAEAVGVPAIKVKLLAYVIGAMIGAIGGMFFAARFGTIDPTSFTYATSIVVLIVVIVGGMGSIPGMILGATVVIVLPEILRPIQNYRLLIFAFALIVMMLVRPKGLWPVARPRHGSFMVSPGEWELEERERAPDGELLLRVTDLERNFGGVRAVNGVSFDVHAGEIVSIIGPNGAGKTTIFNCLTGMVPIERGSVLLEGRSVRRLRPHTIVGLGMARTFQGIRLFSGLSVVENCLVGLTAHQDRLFSLHGLLRRTNRRDRRAALHWLKFVGLADRAHLLASELSYGDKRRLEIARALVSRPKVVLLDEPAAGTNATEKVDLMKLVRQVRDAGVAVLLIEHDMELVMNVSDRVIVLDQGEVIAAGPPEVVRIDARVIEAYLGSEELDETAMEVGEEVLGWRS
jgi:branched-chain amino acid transport system permease protein